MRSSAQSSLQARQDQMTAICKRPGMLHSVPAQLSNSQMQQLTGAVLCREQTGGSTGHTARQPDTSTFVGRFAHDEAWRLQLQDDLHELAVSLYCC